MEHVATSFTGNLCITLRDPPNLPIHFFTHPLADPTIHSPFHSPTHPPTQVLVVPVSHCDLPSVDPARPTARHRDQPGRNKHRCQRGARCGQRIARVSNGTHAGGPVYGWGNARGGRFRQAFDVILSKETVGARGQEGGVTAGGRWCTQMEGGRVGWVGGVGGGVGRSGSGSGTRSKFRRRDAMRKHAPAAVLSQIHAS